MGYQIRAALNEHVGDIYMSLCDMRRNRVDPSLFWAIPDAIPEKNARFRNEGW